MSIHFETVEQFLTKAGFKSLDETYEYLSKINKSKKKTDKDTDKKDDKDDIIAGLNKTIITLRESIELLKSEKEEKNNEENEIKDLEIKKLKKEIKTIKTNKKEEKNIDIKEHKDYKELANKIDKMEKELNTPESSTSLIKNSEEYKRLLKKNDDLSLEVNNLNNKITESIKKVINPVEEKSPEIIGIPENKRIKVALARNLLKQKIKEKGEIYARQCVRQNDMKTLKCCFEKQDVLLSNTEYNYCGICYTSYKIDKNNKLLPHIEKRFIIKDEDEIIKKYTCKDCKKVNINVKNKMCNFCSKFDNSIFTLDINSDDPKNLNLFKKYSNKTNNSIDFYNIIYEIAIESKVDVHSKNPFVEFVKNNDYYKYQSAETIWKKVNRCRYIKEMFSHKDYKNIETSIIKIDINFITRLNNSQWDDWKKYFINYMDGDSDEESDGKDSSDNKKDIKEEIVYSSPNSSEFEGDLFSSSDEEEQNEIQNN